MQTTDTDQITILESGTLRSGAPYQIVLLNADYLDQITALHDATVAGLAGNEKVFMLHKDRNYFAAHLHKGHGNAVIGILSEGQLIAQALIIQPLPGTDSGLAETSQPPETISVLSGVCTDPEFRGNGLMNRMVWHWLDHAAAHGRSHVFSEIDIANTASWAAFIHGGLSLEKITLDPRDGGTIYTAHETTEKALQKRLSSKFNHAAGIACPVTDIAAQKHLMDGGYSAVAWNKAQKTLIFSRRI